MPLENVDDVYPLTPMQRLMLVHAASGSAIGGANGSATGLLDNQFRYEIDGPLNRELFERAWNAVVARHAALRTAVLWDGLDQPLQVVRTRVALRFTYVALDAEPSESRRARLEELCAADAAQPHDLSRAPLMRCTLVRLGSDEHYLIWNVHHLIVDRWSHELIFADVAACYAAWASGVEPELEPAGQFREYVAWLQRRSDDEAEDFWRRELRGFRRASLLTALASGRPRGPRARTHHRLSSSQSQALERRAAEWKSTSASVLLAGLAIVLARRTGTADVAWGLTVSGRSPTVDRVEHTVGSFVGNVPVRTIVDPARSLGAWVRDIQAGQVARQPFEHVSPATIREAAPLPAAEPLFDLLVVVNQESRGAQRPMLPYTMRPAGATFDGAHPLVLGILNVASGVAFTLVHDESFAGAPELLSELDTVVHQLVSAPSDARLADIIQELPSPSTGEDVAALQPFDAPLAAGDDPTALIHGIWCDVLGLDAVALDDDLFELGGSSLQATRIFAILSRRLGRSIPLSLLLHARSIRALAQSLVGAAATGDAVGDAVRDADATPIQRLVADDPAPLSFAQERLWILDQLDGASAVYNMAEAFQLRGALQADALRTALERLLDRHRILRASYPERDGEAVQVRSENGLDWGSEDASEISEPGVVEARLAAAAWQPFPLGTGPLFRARLFRLGAEEHLLLIVMHHSVSDGWSVGILKHELGQLYNAFVQGVDPALPELPFQYSDFARWQRDQLGGERLDELVSYWRETLKGISPLDLPTDRPRPAIQTFRGGVVRASLDPELVRRLRELSRHESATLNMTLTAAFHVLLARYSGQTDVVVGAPFAGRTRADTESLVGMFVNTLVIRSDCTGHRTFRELLRQIRTRSLEAHARQELPFEKLVEELQPVRDLSRNPIVQVLFSLQDTPDRALALDRIEVVEAPLNQGSSKFDLSLYLREERGPGASGRLEALWEFAADLFDHSTIARMHNHFETLLSKLVDDPACRIGELPLMGDRERHEVLVEWNDTTVLRTPAPSVQHLFELQAARTPEAPAVSDALRTLSYAELEAQANQLAHHLLDQELAPAQLLGIRLSRSVDSVVAMLAVMKAGFAFIPLDPAIPDSRTMFMLDDVGASGIVTTSDLLGSLPLDGMPTMCLDRDAAVIDGRSTVRPPLPDDSERLAYVIYTSGSTGRPKGVEVTHANLVHSLCGMIDGPGLSDADVVLAVTTLAFDPALLERLGPLLVGGHVWLADAADVASGERFAERLNRGGFTLLQATPATFRMLFDAGWEGDRGLRVFVGGEALPRSLAQRLAEQCAEVWNVYGPTEATIWSSCWRVSADAVEIRIGRPISYTQMYVLDDLLQPVPPGVPGQLYIGGEGVTRGYRGRPDLTAQHFVPNPFVADPSARLYATGDRVRLGADRELEYLERTDRQVKIRGFRIELGEIEAVLTEHDGIRQSLVLGRGTGTLDARLVAYVVIEPGASVTPSEIRRYLRERLPDYMVPGFVLEIEHFPLTPNGKVDRAALPDPLASTVRATAEHIPPETPGEILIARIWSSLLGRDAIGRHDNFYELGGHSLLGLKAAAAIRREAGFVLNPRAMFFQTLTQLAEQLERNES